MGDKPTSLQSDKLKKVRLENTSVSHKTIIKKYKKSSKGYKRRNRRKRSKKTYLNMLKSERFNRGTQELCHRVQEFSVVDMDMTPLCDLTKLPKEVTEWQQKEQIAYWKSKAITLEIENKMLKQHLRDIYAQQVDYYEKNKHWQEVAKTDNSSQVKFEQSKGEEQPTSTAEKSKVLVKEPEGKNRLKEMEKIYGDKAAKIMGMETALQLNYERLVEEASPSYWPTMPL